MGIPDGFEAAIYALPGNLYDGCVFVGDLDRRANSRMDVFMGGLPVKRALSPGDNTAFAGLFLYTPGSGFEQDAVAFPSVYYCDVHFHDYDADGDLDVLYLGATVGGSSFAPATLLWENTGAGNNRFQRVGAGFINVHNGSADWGDYDNDGDADLLLTGVASDDFVTRIYRNLGQGRFEETLPGIEGIGYGDATWGDFDNDADLDILITGMTRAGQVLSKIYRNDNGRFEDTGIPLPGLAYSKAAWFDFDSDGRLDVVLSGGFYNPFIMEGNTTVLRNAGATFEAVPVEGNGLFDGDLTTGDWDHDGDPDFIVSGRINAALNPFVTRFYRNEGDAFRIGYSVQETHRNAFALADYDRDFDLDVFITGFNPTPGLVSSTVFFDNVIASNNPPSPPTGLQAVAQDRSVTLTWLPASDDKTASDGLTYNVRVGTAPGLSDVVSAQSEPDGLRWLSAPGNVGTNTSWPLTLPRGTYYWSVQALDASYAGSAFAEEQSFELTGDPDDQTPPMAPQALAASAGDRHIVLRWAENTEPDLWQYRLYRGTSPMPPTVLASIDASQTHFYDAGIVQDETYYYRLTAVDLSGNESAFSTEVTSTPRVLFVEDPALAIHSNRRPAAWGDFDNDGDLDLLLPTSTTTYVWRNDGDQFTGIANPTYVGNAEDRIAWADYDRDNDLDFVLSSTSFVDGMPFTTFFRNDEGAFVEERALTLPGVKGTPAWGDIDHDGDLDLLLAGKTATQDTVAIFRNDEGTFTEHPGDLRDLVNDKALWVDFDADNDLDILLTGEAPTHLLRNDGAGYTPVDGDFNNLTQSAAAWGDYDADGDLDLIVTGRHASLATPTTQIYQQEQGGELRLVSADLTGIENGAVAWGDYDNDGSLDLILAGRTTTGPRTQLYLNDNATFYEAGITLPGVDNSTVAWGDYDHDADLDLLITGLAGTARVYRNETTQPNAAPTPPVSLSTTISEDTVTLHWSAGDDAETPPPGLAYNLRVGTMPGGTDVVSPMADIETGSRHLPVLGNVAQRLAGSLTGLPAGAYFWSVQAIDPGFKGSPFAEEASFVMPSGSTEFATVQETETGSPSLTLFPAYPNPFRERTTIRFSLLEPADVRLVVYDLLGRHITTLAQGIRPSGIHAASWEVEDNPKAPLVSGIYLCRLEVNDRLVSTQMMTLIR